MKSLTTNWKTTAAAVAVALVTAATTLGYLTAAQSTEILGVLAAFGFAVAKDHNVTGGTTPQ